MFNRYRGSTSGFTLIECLIALAALAALCCIAIPSLSDAAAKTRDAAIRAAVVESLQRATTHAVATSTHVVLCPSADGHACLNSTNWSLGWIAFADPDKNRERSNVRDTLLQVQPALDGGSRLRGTAGRTRLVVQPEGHTAGSNVTFTICRHGSPARATAMTLANSGRWRFSSAPEAASSACAYGD